jgi:hypothetical protein
MMVMNDGGVDATVIEHLLGQAAEFHLLLTFSVFYQSFQ